MSRVRDKADFQFAGEDYTHAGGVRYVANAITTSDLDANGTISNIHLQDIADVAAVSASNDGFFLKYDHGTTAFVWSQVSGGGGGTMNDLVDDTTPQLGGDLDGQTFDITTTGKILYANVYNNIGDLPSASTYHGMFAHVHGTGYGYFAHAGNWLRLVNEDTSGNASISGNLTVTGDFTVNGTTTTINTTELKVSDNIITLNNDVTGTPSQNAGIEVERGSDSNVDIRWNETINKWQFTNNGSTYLDIGAGGDVIDDPSPQLGGDLDVNGNAIEYTFSLSGSSSPNYIFAGGNNFFSGATNNPTLYLTRGVKYKFTNISSSHPFRIQSVNSAGGTLYNVGVTNNAGSGTVTFIPPMNAPDELYYYCGVHSSMNGTINIVGGSGGASTGDISFSGSTITSSGTTVTVDDNLTVTGNLTSSQAGSPILQSATSLTLQAADRVHVNQSPLRLYNIGTTARNALTSSDGDLVYDEDLDEVYAYQNGSWASLSGGGSSGHTFTVTAPGASYYQFAQDNKFFTSNENNPDLFLTRGETYNFVINANGHPFYINHTNATGTANQFTDGVSNAGTTNGTLVFTVPMDCPDILYYNCSVHGAMNGVIYITGDSATTGKGYVTEQVVNLSGTSGTIAFDIERAAIQKIPTNLTANSTLNFRANSTSSFGSKVTYRTTPATNESLTCVAIVDCDSNGYYFSTIQIDGSSVTPLWSGGTAPSTGGTSGTDVYTFTIVNFAGTYQVFGALQNYA